ncbi:retention module-containing protein [Pseudomonas sp. PDM25]|uniref:retention module-containing protein n=1 Tax=Pseudomonas sp. PDM25 TaxID=2854772 RepID=UPI001C45C9A5|nr:retention module-containing protein [Pseudomonas sp. PDM25]MBV7511303.1 retention module-containing protein [Pseudomonas sp. PDM25]
MATLIGIVSKVIGQVFAVAGDGTRRALVEGDRLFAGDQLVTGAEGAVAVHLHNGQELTLGRGSSMEMTPQLLANQAPHVDTAEAVTPTQAQLTDVEQLQKAIAAGDDPTQTAEATAAGPGSTGAPGALGGGHSFVMLEEVGGRVDPTIGFPTAGFNGIPEFPLGRLAGNPDNGAGGSGGSGGSGGAGGSGGTGVLPVTPDVPDVPVVPVTPVVPDVPNNPVTLTGLSVAGGELTVNEANLADGSAPDPEALTKTGTFSVSAPDGLTSLSIAGVNVIIGGVAAGFPQSITTPLGNTLTVTGYNPATGVVSYSYTLVDNETHPTGDGANSITENLDVVATDTDGSSATGQINVNIVDDLPTANPDSTAVEEGGIVSGNVLWNDVAGADGPAAGGAVLGVRAGSDTSAPAVGGLNSQINGTYGYLTLDANGNAEYHSNPNAVSGPGATDTFTYTLRDADGDQSTTTITIDVHNCSIRAVSDSDVTVYEKALDLNQDGQDLAPGTVTGSLPGNTGETASGTLAGSVSGAVGAITYTLVGSATGTYGQILLNPDGSYTYTLTSPASTTPHANDGPNTLSESFTYQATDAQGNSTTSTIVVNIVDDLPTAHADEASVAEGGVVSGNVLWNDVGGADGLAAGGAVLGVRAGSDTSTSAVGGLNTQINGTYGYLTLDANGNAVYHSNPNAVSDPGATDTFTYTVRDADGDQSTTTITIDVHNSSILAVSDSDVTVYEKALDLNQDGQDLAPGTVTGSLPGNTGETASGTLAGSVTGATGAITYTLVGSATGTYGQILLNPDGSYTYTLTSPASTTSHANDGPNTLSESFTYQATDALGNSTTSTIVVNIVDDLPTAHADEASVAEGGTVSGNVLWNDVGGADGLAAGGAVLGVRAGSDTSTSAVGGLNTQINGTYGYLTLDANGNAVYHSNPNAVSDPGATDTFTYTVRDADGDQSTTTITIDVHNSSILAVSDSDVTVYEKALDLNQDGQDLAPGTVTGSLPGNTGETASGTLAGSVSGAVGAITYTLVGSATGTYGQILLNPDGSYTYTLTSAPSTTPHANDGPNTLSESFTYQATDALGNSTTSTIVVNIVDDLPTAHADEASVAEGGTVSGNVLWNDVGGADGLAAGGAVLGVRAGSDTSTSAVGGLNTQINGTYGYLTLDANGNAVYHSNPNAVSDPGATDTFTYTVRDADGDQSTTTITIDVHNSGFMAVSDSDVTVYEKALDLNQDGQDLAPGTVTGSQPGLTAETASGTLVGSVTGATGAITYTLVGSATGTYGQILLNPDGSYTYTLTSAPSTTPHANDGDNTLSESFTYQATDALGHSTTSTIVVNIVDDLPTANPDAASVVEGGIVSGNVLANDFGDADGVGVVGVRAGSDTSNSAIGGLNSQINGTYGYLTLDAAGNAVYHSNPDAVNGPGATDVFTYTLRDGDGDERTTTITIDVNDSCIIDNGGDQAPVIANTPPVAVDDHIITNVLSDHIVVPEELLLANDTDADKDPLTASPTSFNTGWIAKGADFTGTNQNFSFIGGNEQAVTLARSAFVANTTAMTAVLVVSGALGPVDNTHAEDRITIDLKQGETLNLDHNLPADHVAMEYSINGGAWVALADGQTLTATSDSTYQIHITNIDNPGPGNSGNGAENYQLTMTVDYAGAHDITPDAHGTYAANDSHGGSDSGAVTITYQDGHTLTGTAGDDVLLAGAGNNVINAGDGNDVLTAGSGNNEMHGDAGNDLLYSGAGNDLLDGGTGVDTASYAHATAGVTVNLGVLGAQNTAGAGTDTLTAIENLTGSNFNDSLTGDNHSNIINGGLGDDMLNGGGGDDFLIGGLGNNTLTGGSGADTFQWLKGNSGHDVVTDFTPGIDKLDLSQLLQGENSTAASLDDYLHFKVTGSGESLVTSIDVSAMAGAAPNQTIDLAGVNLASHYGVTPGAGGVIAGGQDTATIINGMLNDHSLKVDTV